MNLLNSNYCPVKTKNKDFQSCFFDCLGDAIEIQIASGYIAEDAIADLIGLYETGFTAKLTLIIGMHYFEGFTYAQINAVKKLADVLEKYGLGNIFLSKSLKYHGKVYQFLTHNNKLISIIGSSNLTKIAPSAERIYDTDILLSDTSINKEINDFLYLLRTKSCENIKNIHVNDLKISTSNNLFQDYIDVELVSGHDIEKIKSDLTNISFDIQLKTTEKSNLNCFFGQGRKNFSNGSILPRPWYEVELIVSNKITQDINYPKNAIFTVITDDGYKFDCKTSGDFSKNFRSAADLKILGRWIKGRMEEKQVLSIGSPVTDEVLKNYGRSSLTLTKTNTDNTWFLDFGV